MTASTSQSGMEEAMGDEASPFEPEYETKLTKTYTAGATLEELLKFDSPFLHLGSFDWAKIPFELRMEKLADVTDASHKDLILHVDVHRDYSKRLGGPDPHWRCTFAITVRTKTQDETEWIESTTMTCKADKQLKSFVVPLRRLGEGTERECMTVEVNMKILSWAGVFPTPIPHSFSRKTDTTDATLKVDGRTIYVTRAILAMRSKFFHGLFFNRSFKDHAKEEFELKDVAFDDMCTFLRLIYPPDSPEKPIRIANMASLEAMLELADRWDCPYVSKEMERYLLDEIKPSDTIGFTPSRCLYLADRYRLSSACNFNMTRLANASSLKGFVKTLEFKEISDGLCRTLLEMLAATEDDNVPSSGGWTGGEGFSRKRAHMSCRSSNVHHPRTVVSVSQAQVSFGAPSSSSFSSSSLLYPAHPTYTEFKAMVGNVLQSAPGFALPSKQSAELLAGLHFLQDLSTVDYGNLSRRQQQRYLYQALEGVLSKGEARPQDRESLHANIEELIVRVGMIPGGAAAVRQLAQLVES